MLAHRIADDFGAEINRVALGRLDHVCALDDVDELRQAALLLERTWDAVELGGGRRLLGVVLAVVYLQARGWVWRPTTERALSNVFLRHFHEEPDVRRTEAALECFLVGRGEGFE